MTTPESFDDQELAALFTAEEQRERDDLQLAYEGTVVKAILWDAIAKLDITLAHGQDPSTHDANFHALIDAIGEIAAAVVGPETATETDIRSKAHQLWDEEETILTQIAMTIGMQRFDNLSIEQKTFLKKDLMATVSILDPINSRWLELIDETLDGEPLDIANPADAELVITALETASNLESTPEVQLYDTVLQLLGAPALAEDIPDDADTALLELLTYTARDITETAITMPGHDYQPDRHARIYAIIRSCGIHNQALTHTILAVTDNYAA